MLKSCTPVADRQTFYECGPPKISIIKLAGYLSIPSLSDGRSCWDAKGLRSHSCFLAGVVSYTVRGKVQRAAASEAKASMLALDRG